MIYRVLKASVHIYRWLDSGSSSMAVFEVGIPSGFTADITGVNSEPSHKRVDVESRKLIVYFDQVSFALNR